MRIAVISDIHANLPALEAVLAAIDGSECEQIWCLGDVVGYGAEPNECAALVIERSDVCLAGNHDLGVLGAIDISTFSPVAAESAQWTQAHLADKTREYLANLAPADETQEVAIYHASPRDHVWEYVLWPDQAGECLRVQKTRVALIGHSHMALFFQASPDGDIDATEGAQVPGGTVLDVRDGSWLLNPGSVGQPRDGDPRAAWMDLDTERWMASYERLPYDVEKAAASIAAAGLPEHLSRRLYTGQ